jgi:hypothetical protein
MRLFLMSSVLLVGSLVAGADESPRNGQLVTVATEEIFVPLGFDDNDEIMVVVDGFLPSSCYRLTRPEVAIDEATHQITVSAVARYYDAPCVQSLIPFSQEVPVGILPQGEFTVKSAAGDVTRSLMVKEATSAGPDDFLYAPVERVTIDKDPDTGGLAARIEGRFTNSCMQWQEAMVSANDRTIVVQPIMSLTDGNECAPEQRRFNIAVPLPADIAEGRNLLHVRSLNGKAVNLVFNHND